MTCHVIWEAFAESALLVQRRRMFQREGRNQRFRKRCDFQDCSTLNGIAIRLPNHDLSDDLQRTRNERFAFCQWLRKCCYSPVFLLTYVNVVRSIPRGLQSHVPVLSPLSSKSQCSQRGCVVMACWRGANMRLGWHFYEVFAVSPQPQLRCWANISPRLHGLPVSRRNRKQLSFYMENVHWCINFCNFSMLCFL